MYVSSGCRNLILIEFAVLVLLFPFFLKGDDDEADEDVDHEESDDDDVDEEEDGNTWSTVVQGTEVLAVRVNAAVHQPTKVVQA